jgi:YegS/Rv2252/BmrU family lipid kinase
VGAFPEREAARGAESAVPRRTVLLTSPNAGNAHRLGAARTAMLEAGFEILREIPVERHDELAGWVARPDGERPLIVAAGGDGTVGTAADDVAGSGAVLGVLPLGTANDFARSIGIPMNPVRAARLLATGTVTTIDAGRMVAESGERRHFVHAATAGLNVSFAKLATKASLRERAGRLTYAIAGARALREHEPFDCELHHDTAAERVTLVHLAVVNAPVFGGFLGMRLSSASLDDRVLDVIAVERISIRRLLLAALYPLLGIRRRVLGVRTLQLSRLRVVGDRQLEVALDGEIRGTIPATFEAAGGALRVVAPRGFEGGARPASR